MNYTINVSHHGQHYFATTKRSLTTLKQAHALYDDFSMLFPRARGYRLELSEVVTTGQVVRESDPVGARGGPRHIG